MTATARETSTNKSAFLTEVDWDNYTAYRPIYPPSLKALILAHHDTHSSSRKFAHDVGSGSGVFAGWLAEHFSHVHVSDPNPTFLSAAREKLRLWKQQQQQRETGMFSFSVCKAEKADEVALEETVDFVSLMMSAHWTIQEEMAVAVGKSLAPGGSLVVVQINPAPRVVPYGKEDEKVQDAVHSLFEFWGKSLLAFKGGEHSEYGSRFFAQQNAGLECLPLPAEFYDQTATKRIEINLQERGKRAHMVPGLEHCHMDYEINPLHQRFVYTSEDEEGRGWQYEVDAEWFRGLISTLDTEDRLHLYEERLKEVEETIKSCCAGGKVKIEWTVAALLATRKRDA